ncbi:hypothetical protein DPX16_6769 [Anabarilius grahami]|uniref:Uncharacterized protein n=1 Tax=Anabarilius grahami TaxID=495550 RepID=A0A3N0Y5L2_ANAGA|nr:hypothetical protein DPX16_6769 [Anabarilius grahami]
MPRHDDMTSFLQQPASLFDQRVVSKFMKTRPKVMGSVLTGSVTISAASKCDKCQVLISQFLNCFNAIAAVVSVPFHCVDSDGMTLILLVVCDVLVFIISVIVASSSCDCCTKKSRDVAVSYINRDVPYMTDNNIVLQGQLGPFAPPPNYEPSPPAPPPNYDAVPSAPLLRYDSGLFEPPPSYNQVLLDLQ